MINAELAKRLYDEYGINAFSVRFQTYPSSNDKDQNPYIWGYIQLRLDKPLLLPTVKGKVHVDIDEHEPNTIRSFTIRFDRYTKKELSRSIKTSSHAFDMHMGLVIPPDEKDYRLDYLLSQEHERNFFISTVDRQTLKRLNAIDINTLFQIAEENSRR